MWTGLVHEAEAGLKILVTGGAGYIGSVTAAALLESGHEVVVFDNLSQGHRAAVPEEAVLVVGDLRDPAAVAGLFAEQSSFDGIMHFASYTLVGESMEQPLLYLRDNVVAASNLLEEATHAGVRRFILSSTANLFDDPERIPIGAHERIVPGSPYGESKHFIERLLHWFHRIHGWRYACLRYFNAAGSDGIRGEDHDPELHLIPRVLQVARGRRDVIQLFGGDYPTPDGTCVRDYIHVSDLAQAHILALAALDDLQVRHYNLGNGTGFSNLQVVQTAREVTGHAIPHEIGPRRPGDPAVLVASSEEIKSELGWRPERAGLEDIVRTAWDWHRAHPDGYAM